MARRPHFDDFEQNNDRWLVSYADFITLLFAFFVVMYAMSSVQTMKFEQLSASLGQALGSTSGHGPPMSTAKFDVAFPTLILGSDRLPFLNAQLNVSSLPNKESRPQIPPPTPPETEKQVDATESALSAEKKKQLDILQHDQDEMRTITEQLQQRLAGLVETGKVRITQSSWGISVEINASILFASADAQLNPDSIQTLQSIADVLKNQPHFIHVEGHTDNKPIHTAQYPSNWELSAARAGSVIRLFIDSGIVSSRLTAIGHADNQPMASNDLDEGRLRNRRVQLMILNNSTVNSDSRAISDSAEHL